AEERLSLARRIVADRCLYGVDKNPMAVEMAKLSLWLITLAKGKPFTFLDHRLKHGDSLVGCIWRPKQMGSQLLPLPAEIPGAAWFWPPTRDDGPLAPTTDLYLAVLERGAEPPPDVAEKVAQLRARIPFFHWALEFPDVLTAGGFDAIVSNPPFQGGKLISGA